ncbi:MAG: hypothetical protein GY742_13360 [Hyphomicrobiales bacterium]|nr:hypothetical protein [Hyphomicrobiales bacterium]
MPVDIEEAKLHFANKSAWHHIKGKVIEVGLYIASNSVKLNKPAPRNMSVWTLEGDQAPLDGILQKNQDENKLTILNLGSFTCPSGENDKIKSKNWRSCMPVRCPVFAFT